MRVKVGTFNESNRIKWIEAVLKQIPAGSRILDAGAGEQQFRKACSHLNYVAQDFSQYDGKGNERGLQTGAWNQSKLDIVCDIASIPEADASFDAVMCTEVFEHLPDPLPAIKEFNRLMKTGGHLVVTAPFCSLTHFAPYHYSTGFNAYYYERHLKAAGFEILEIEANGNFFEFIAQEIRRIHSVAYTYSCGRMNLLERLSLKIILKMLERFSGRDKGSEELLCFGYHIYAKKIINPVFKNDYR